MVHRFEPHICSEPYRDDQDYAGMFEDRNGRWVKFSTFDQVTSGHLSEITKLKKHIATLQSQLKEMKENIPIKLHTCANCDSHLIRQVTQFETYMMVCGNCGEKGPSCSLNNNNWKIDIIKMWNKRQERANKKKQLATSILDTQLMD